MGRPVFSDSQGRQHTTSRRMSPVTRIFSWDPEYRSHRWKLSGIAVTVDIEEECANCARDLVRAFRRWLQCLLFGHDAAEGRDPSYVGGGNQTPAIHPRWRVEREQCLRPTRRHRHGSTRISWPARSNATRARAFFRGRFAKRSPAVGTHIPVSVHIVQSRIGH